uniref:G_PROTEIN_RECEP_F1_2 domain-containing protein n=1 Tax=Ascaris lumbricoides TaxID=6252 RepID=A0A0M3HG99_ASCLU
MLFSPDSNLEDGSKLGRIYGTAVMTLQFGVPALISSFCYWRISRVITQQIEKRREQQIMLKESEKKLTSRRTRSNRMMVCMVLGLVLAWLPLNLINLSRDFNGVTAWFSTIFAFCHVIAMTSAAWNPVIYSWFNPQLRMALKSIMARSTPTSERLPLVNVLKMSR